MSLRFDKPHNPCRLSSCPIGTLFLYSGPSFDEILELKEVCTPQRITFNQVTATANAASSTGLRGRIVWFDEELTKNSLLKRINKSDVVLYTHWIHKSPRFFELIEEAGKDLEQREN